MKKREKVDFCEIPELSFCDANTSKDFLVNTVHMDELWKCEQELEKKIQRAKVTSILDGSGFDLKKFPIIMASVMEKTIVMKMCNNKLSTVPKDIKGWLSCRSFLLIEPDSLI